MYIYFIEMNRKAYPDLQKEKRIHTWAAILVKHLI